MKTDGIVEPREEATVTDRPQRPGFLRWKESMVLAALTDRTSLAGEQFRKLGLKLEGLNETLGGQMKLVLVTSPLMGDGKTATAANLAVSLAQEEGRRVALVDCDTRNPQVQALFSPPPRRGLYELLAGHAEMDAAREMAEQPALDIYALPRGIWKKLDPLPMDRLRGVFSRMRQSYDFVVCDGPPVLPVADTAALVRLADGVIVVVRAGRTPRQAVSQTLSTIDRSKLIGFVLNAVNENSVASYYYPYHEETGSGGEGKPK